MNNDNSLFSKEIKYVRVCSLVGRYCYIMYSKKLKPD